MTWRLGLALALFLVMVATSAWWSGRVAAWPMGAPPAPTHRPAPTATSWSNRRHN